MEFRIKDSLVAFPLSLVLTLTACQPEPGAQVKADSAQAPSAKAPTQRDINLWPEAVSPFVRDEKLEARVDELLGQMTLEQKVAQMIQPEIRDFTVEDMRRYGFGSFLNGGGAYPNNDKHARIQDWVELAETLYQAGLDASEDGIAIPPMWGTDAVHGHNNVIGATLFPHNIGLGAAHNPALIEEIAAATAKEVAATGIDWVFAPTVAVVRDDRWGRSYEGYGEYPELIKEYSAAFVRGMQGVHTGEWLTESHTLSTAKHFIGDGGTLQGDDQGDTRVSESELIEIHGQGYVSAIEAGVQTIMVSFNSWWGEKNHGNHYLLTQVLKERMGFDGVLVGDWNGHGQLPGCTIDSCPEAINAGLDIFMVPTDAWKPLYHNTIAQVQEGTIAQERIDDAVRRVLRIKFRAGLFDKPSPAKRALAGDESLIGSQQHRALARKAVRESLVMLKNNGQLLPLSPRLNVLVAGDGADNIGKQAGGWSITWQGTDNLNSDFPGATSIYDGIAQHLASAGGKAVLSEDGSWSGEKPDVAIVVFGEEPYAEGNGDLANLEYQRGAKRDLALLESFKAQGIPVVSVFVTGRPLWVNPELNASDAFVVAWLPGTEAGGVADLLFRDGNEGVRYDFRGRLSFSWPNSPNGDAQAEESSGALLFKRGYGLSVKDDVELSGFDEAFDDSVAGPELLSLLDGVVKAPWKVWVGDGQQMEQVRSNTQVTSNVTIRDIDKRIQQDARRISFNKQGTGVVRFQADFPQDLRAFGEVSSGLVMEVRSRGDRSQPLTLTIGCGDGCRRSFQLDAATLPGDEWQELSVDLTCFNLTSAELDSIFVPLELSSMGDWELEVSNIRWQPDAAQTQVQCGTDND
ncbi:exo 1,3/1,4-beta-D-glucan glucohydrolase [Shewanella submarina]|uniref:Exo 1,3/1,4-beta-D-glucan glucohydrolase n=1 Tax=Shewanella submarina TaxID=2016376 RepID=A0ABV7GC69_9GAMM|nr:exo 1,3/1,4-beta-D-glucan glucohydrolase [Shewanella submarina]